MQVPFIGPGTASRTRLFWLDGTGFWVRRGVLSDPRNALAGAVPRAREYLPWIHQTVGVKRRFDAPLRVDEHRGLFKTQVGRLGETNAVFAAERAAQLHRGPEQFHHSLVHT